VVVEVDVSVIITETVVVLGSCKDTMIIVVDVLGAASTEEVGSDKETVDVVCNPSVIEAGTVKVAMTALEFRAAVGELFGVCGVGK
jgi:hypothetical protein